MILTGLAIMSFGLFLFYALLPLLYGLIGFDIGLLLGRWLTGAVGSIAIILGIVVAVILGVASYALEPYRRVLLGVSGGFLFGLALAAVFGVDSWLGGSFGIVLAVICAVIGGLIVPYFFDLFVVVASAIGGAALVVAGAHRILPRCRAVQLRWRRLLAETAHCDFGRSRHRLAVQQHRQVGSDAPDVRRCFGHFRKESGQAAIGVMTSKTKATRRAAGRSRASFRARADACESPRPDRSWRGRREPADRSRAFATTRAVCQPPPWI